MNWKDNLKESLGSHKIVSTWTGRQSLVVKYYIYMSGHIYADLGCQEEIYVCPNFQITSLFYEGALKSTKDTFMKFCNYWKQHGEYDIEIDGRQL